MDSYNFHFERMSNVDLHHLSLPVSRLSPAKSNCSIVDQLAHHQHGKGDSAYSSFSGGSTAPDYPSPFLPEDLQSNSFSHYADLKYVKSIYHPTQVLQSDSKTMDQLYCSVEAISQQYCNNTNTNVNHLNHNGNDSVHTNNKTLLKREMQLGTPAQSSYPHIRPPPVPARLDSFIATKNLENIHHHGSQQQPQAQVPPSYRPHLQPNDQGRVPLNPEYLAIKENKAASEQQKSANNLSRSIPRGTSQPEHLTPKKPLSSGGSNGDHYSKVNNRHLESQCKTAHSAQDWLSSEPARAASLWGNAGQSLIGSSSIQHKGQYYFVTGVWKVSESGLRTHSVSVCESEAGSEVSTVEVFTSVTQGKDLITRSLDQENYRPSPKLTQSSRSFDALEEINSMQNREIGRHTASNPIFYCGPDRNLSPQSTTPTKEITSLITSEQSSHHKRDDHAKRGKWQSLGDVASERINKETTPLLYHLTGANRAALQPKNDPGLYIKGKEIVLNKTGQGDAPVNDSEPPPQGDISKNNRGDDISVACNTLDDSFKKYYKEKLKDAQSKVLRETSFKRRDLQLSWPNRIRQKPELRPAVIHSFSSSQDSETSTDTLTPSTENENGRPINVAQPQVARVRGRKRLTPEQKKMCYSEPEKLNQLGGAPNHSACRSFGNENDDLVAVQYEVEEQFPREEQGLVETRRKMFEKRGRALSASNVSKTNLKHVRHQALVEYMERKTGQKVAEPQQPTPQIPPPPRQRHSLGEKPFDWPGPRPLSGNQEVKNTKKKLHRPHSAGRILDSSTSSIRYAQFFSAQSCSGQYAGQQNQSRWRESQGPSQGKSASAESLLDQPEQPSFLRNRSTSTPHELQVNWFKFVAVLLESFLSLMDLLKLLSGRFLLTNTVNYFRACTVVTCEEKTPAPVDHKQVRVISQRGKSMEELGASRLTKLPALSKSSEQLDHLWRYSSEAGGSDRDKRSISNFAEEREAQGQERKRKKQSVSEQTGKEPEIVGQKGSTSSVTGSEREQCVDEPSSDGQPPDSNHEVSLNSVFDSTSSVPLNHQVEEEKNPEIKDENVGENQEMEERGTPEGEMQGQETPAERPKWEELVEAIVKADQSLARVLYPLANRKTALMLMEQLLSEDTLLMEEHYKKKQEQKASDPSPRPAASDSQKSQSADLQSEADITEKKRLLMSYIETRLRSLEEMRGALQVEVQENTTRGEALQVLVSERCLPVELERYNLFIGDLERVVSLLLCLSARLARVQNALTTVDQNTDAEEKQSLDSRHRLLCKQREDAKDLKDNLDRRENLVSTFLSRQLSTEQLQNYRCFVQTKASLLIRQKDLEEKQRLGEEQLEALTNSLDL
uniref:Shroom family member 1 n=1 Tax=Amphilophus citrinellus TaxID=61819 RepID=A0A3Q0RV08_AMPCI